MDFVFFGKAPDGELYTLYGFGSSLEPPPKKKKKKKGWAKKKLLRLLVRRREIFLWDS